MSTFFTSRLFFISFALVVIAATLPLYVSGYVLDKNDPGAEGAANPCQSNVIITAIEVDVPDA